MIWRASDSSAPCYAIGNFVFGPRLLEAYRVLGAFYGSNKGCKGPQPSGQNRINSFKLI
jgi:hypothetical protein